MAPYTDVGDKRQWGEQMAMTDRMAGGNSSIRSFNANITIKNFIIIIIALKPIFLGLLLRLLLLLIRLLPLLLL